MSANRNHAGNCNPTETCLPTTGKNAPHHIRHGGRSPILVFGLPRETLDLGSAPRAVGGVSAATKFGHKVRALKRGAAVGLPDLFHILFTSLIEALVISEALAVIVDRDGLQTRPKGTNAR